MNAMRVSESATISGQRTGKCILSEILLILLYLFYDSVFFECVCVCVHVCVRLICYNYTSITKKKKQPVWEADKDDLVVQYSGWKHRRHFFEEKRVTDEWH